MSPNMLGKQPPLLDCSCAMTANVGAATVVAASALNKNQALMPPQFDCSREPSPMARALLRGLTTAQRCKIASAGNGDFNYAALADAAIE